jgi:hypothetical protein
VFVASQVEHRYQMEEVFANMGDDDVIYETMLDTMVGACMHIGNSD